MEGALWAANPLLMGTLKLGKSLYDSFFGSDEESKTKAENKTTPKEAETNKNNTSSTNVPKEVSANTPNSKANIATESHTYVVKNNQGNAKIAEMFGITQKALEDSNKDLHQKRGGKGWFWAGDKISIPSPTKQLDSLAINSEKQKEKPNSKEVEKKDTTISSSDCWDKHSNSRLSKIHSKLQADAFKFINTLDKKHNIKVRVTQGLRTIAEQDALYNKGRDASGNVTDKSKIVTNAKGGSSYHNFGLAFDVVEIKDGKALWSNPNWAIIGEVGKSFGFEWGGNWTSLVDKPHFQNKLGYTLSLLRSLKAQGKWSV